MMQINRTSELTLEYDIITELTTEQARHVVTDFMNHIGYEMITMEPLVYIRRESWNDLLRFSPRGIETYAQVNIWSDLNSETIVSVSFEPVYHPMLLRFTEKDWDFWRTEIRNLEEALLRGRANLSLNYLAASRAAWYKLAMVGLGVAGTVLGLAFIASIFS